MAARAPRLRRLLAPFCAALVAAASMALGGARAEMSRELFERIAPAVGLVRGRDCEGGSSRSGTGFLFGGGDRLVTALHVVAGCRRIDAYFERGGGATVGATLDRVLDAQDLALLKLDRSVGRPLTPASSAPQPNDRLDVLAFFLGAQTMDNKSLTVTFGATRLRSMLPAEVRDELRRSRAIDLDLEIVRLDGHLLPGASGAPLVDSQGRVAAVGSGGLRSGAASISWGLPSRHLDGLMRSAARGGGQAAAQSASLFATPEADAPGGVGGGVQRVRCGDLTFVRLGTRGFAELAATTDDPLGLQQLLMHFQQYGVPANVVQGFRFDIYVPDGKGAAVAVPDWMNRPVDSGVCRARGPDGRIEIAFGGTRLANQWAMQGASQQIELALLTHSNWMFDPNFSYPAPAQRPDGLVVRRKTLHGPGPAPGVTSLAFETLAAKGDQLFGIAAINHAHNGMRHQQCLFFGGGPGCDQLRMDLQRLLQAVLAAHLSTFPIY